MMLIPSERLLGDYNRYSGDYNDCHLYNVFGNNSILHGSLISSFMINQYRLACSDMRVRTRYLSPVALNATNLRFSLQEKSMKSSLYVGDILSSMLQVDLGLEGIDGHGQIEIKDIIPFEYSIDSAWAPSEIGGSSLVNDGFALCSYLIGMVYPGKLSTSISYDLVFDSIKRMNGYRVINANSRTGLVSVYIQSEGFYGRLLAAEKRVQSLS